jgi:hypothetical protein
MQARIANDFVISLIEKILELERKYKRGGSGLQINSETIQQDPLFIELQNLTSHLQKVCSHMRQK